MRYHSIEAAEVACASACRRLQTKRIKTMATAKKAPAKKAAPAAKALVFALFPWTLIVRIQNALGVGMKEKPKGGRT